LRCESFVFISIVTSLGTSSRSCQLISSTKLSYAIQKLLLSNQHDHLHDASIAASLQGAYHGTNHSKRTSSEDPDQPRQSTPSCTARSLVERRPSGNLSSPRRLSVFMMTLTSVGRGRLFQTLFVRPGLKSWQKPSGLAGTEIKILSTRLLHYTRERHSFLLSRAWKSRTTLMSDDRGRIADEQLAGNQRA
jgi:hypothetical protein